MKGAVIYVNCLKYKFTFNLILICILLFHVNSRRVKICNTNPYRRLSGAPFRQPTDDLEVMRIREQIQFWAGESMKKTNLERKKILNGILPAGTVDEMEANASKVHSDKSMWSSIMEIPTEVWSFCIYPKYELNVMRWCEKTYSIRSPDKVKDCKFNNCVVCCDHSPFILKGMANKGYIGKTLMMDEESGFRKIRRTLQPEDINKCRKKCKDVYPVNMPNILPPPPRDPLLGKKFDNPALSCADIKKWGGENNKSGKYWLQFNGTKGKSQVYCDLEADNGGWTLFLNYKHLPGQELVIDSSKLPKDLDTNSHIILRDLGYEERDIKEVRFFCTEKTSRKWYWHFKTNSNRVIQTALSGDQTGLSTDAFIKHYNELKFPGRTIGWYKALEQEHLKDLDTVGFNRKGSFWDTPFGSNSLSRFWTVKGNVTVGGRFECGTMHQDNISKEISSLVYTHHSVWFRGEPPTDDEARERYTVRNNRLLNIK